MRPTDVVSTFAPGFIASGIEWMITGGVAAIVYGEPRLTQDLDVVATFGPREAAVLASHFPDPTYYCPPVEVIASEAGRESHGHFNLLHLESGARADIYFAKGDALAVAAIVRPQQVHLAGLTVPLAPADYVILAKLRFRSQGAGERHLRDVRSMLRVLGGDLNVDQLRAQAVALGLTKQWRELTALDD